MPANNHSFRSALVVIVVCGFLLRAWGMWFGMPIRSNLYIRPDESLIVTAAVRFWDSAGHPGFFAYPALMVEICAILYLPWKLLGGIGAAFASEPSIFFLIARGVSVIAGTASILLVHGITRSLASPAAALIAATLFSFSPLAVRDSHFGVTDTLLVFLLLASMAWPVERTGVRDVIIVGAIFGLACSTKYTAILLAPAVTLRLVTPRARLPKVAVRDLVLAGATCACIFVVLNPYVFLLRTQSSGQVSQILNVLYGSQREDSTWNLVNAALQVLRPLRHGPGGYLGLLLAGVSLGFAFRMTLLPIAIAAAAFGCALLPFQHTVPYRYALPMLPFVAILAGCTLNHLLKGLAWKTALTLIVVLPGAWEAVRIAGLLNRTDSRSLASAWIDENVPQRTPVLLLGPPECEPQLVETFASIERRIDYVHRLYGPVSGGIVSEPYKLMRAAAPLASPGREVFRNYPPDQIPGDDLLVVIPSSPLPLLVGAIPAFSPLSGRVVKSTIITSLKDSHDWEFDAIDAFFAPFRPLQDVVRPGPSLRLILFQK